MSRMIVQGEHLSPAIASAITQQLAGRLQWASEVAVIDFDAHQHPEWPALRQDFDCDINVLPPGFDPAQVRLLVTDMDSTLISIECIDEIADFQGIKAQVAAITEAAMRGEIDFETSLRSRVALLKGLPVERLERVYQERLRLNPGAETLIAALKQRGVQIALVSGGFTFFTERLRLRLGLDDTLANVLGEANGLLTGSVEGTVCGAQAKADFLRSKAHALGLARAQTVALGDGANDLLMMAEAGLSVAYHAKPTVAQQANTRIDHGGLEVVLGLLQTEIA